MASGLRVQGLEKSKRPPGIILEGKRGGCWGHEWGRYGGPKKHEILQVACSKLQQVSGIYTGLLGLNSGTLRKERDYEKQDSCRGNVRSRAHGGAASVAGEPQ